LFQSWEYRVFGLGFVHEFYRPVASFVTLKYTIISDLKRKSVKSLKLTTNCTDNILANTPQAKKRARQNDKRRIHNMSQRSALRTAIKKLLKLISDKNADEAKAAYQSAVSHIDRASSKGLHHANRAARLKQRLNNRLRAISN